MNNWHDSTTSLMGGSRFRLLLGSAETLGVRTELLDVEVSFYITRRQYASTLMWMKRFRELHYVCILEQNQQLASRSNFEYSPCF